MNYCLFEAAIKTQVGWNYCTLLLCLQDVSEGQQSKLSWNESSLLLSFVSDVQMHSVVLGTLSNGKPRQIPTKVLQENFLHASKFGKKKKRVASIFRVACFWRLKFTMVFKMPSSNASDQLVSAANERALCVWSYNFL